MELKSWRVWLRPGMVVKRWVLLFLVSVVVMGLAFAMGLAWVYRNVDFPTPVQDTVYAVTLQSIPHPWRETIVLVAGGCVFLFSLWSLTRSLITPIMKATPGRQNV